MESPEGQASSLESIGRALSRRNHGRSRAVVLAEVDSAADEVPFKSSTRSFCCS